MNTISIEQVRWVGMENKIDNFSVISSNWQYVLAPARPNIIELNRIEILLSDMNRSSHVAVLGSTIEFRNLLHKLGFENMYIFENNKDFYEFTNSWITHDIEKENIIWGDWKDTLQRFNNFFSLVLSDEIIGFIKYEDREKFYENIFNMLIPGGFFVDKELTHPMSHIPLQNLIDKYMNIPINLQSINDFCCEVLFCSDLLDINNIVDTSFFYKVLYEKYSNNPIIKKYLDLAHLVIPEQCVWYYGKLWNIKDEKYFTKYSETIIYDDVPDSPYFGRVKQFINIK